MQSLWLCKTYMKEGGEREEGERSLPVVGQDTTT